MMIARLQDPGPHCYHSNASAWTATWTGIHRYHSLTFKRFCMDRYTSLLPLTFKPFQMLLHYTLCTSYQSLSFATTSLYSLITNSNKYNFFSCHIWSYVNALKSWKTTLRVVKMLSEPLKWLWERCTLPKKVARHFDRFDRSSCSGKRPKRPEWICQKPDVTILMLVKSHLEIYLMIKSSYRTGVFLMMLKRLQLDLDIYHPNRRMAVGPISGKALLCQ